MIAGPTKQPRFCWCLKMLPLPRSTMRSVGRSQCSQSLMSNLIESRLISRPILGSIDFGLFLQPQRLGERRAVARGRYFTALEARPFDLELAGTCARLPVIRTPSMVCHGEDNDPVRFHPVDERKWKPLHHDPTCIRARGRTRERKSKGASRGLFHRGGEACA